MNPSLHSQIMNLPTLLPVMVGLTPEETRGFQHGYKEGHRDVRHAAAELVLPLEERCKELEAENKRLKQGVRWALGEDQDDVGEGPSMYQVMQEAAPNQRYYWRSELRRRVGL